MNIPKIRSKDLTSVTDFSPDEIISIFKFTEKLKKLQKRNRAHEILKGKTLAMIFEKRSTRTRVSFEAGMFQLGGHALFLGKDDLQLGRGETVSDTAKVLSRYVDAIMIRTFSHESVMELAKNSRVPVINGLTDSYHPCQALTDFFTIYELRKSFRDIKLAYVGDGNNMANSLLLCSALLGVHISAACPEGYLPDDEVVKKSRETAIATGARVDVTTNPEDAAKNADFIYTDVWVSMGQEQEAAERLKAFSGYRITRRLLDLCAPDCRVMHCLPAHRGEEIDADVLDSDRSVVMDQAENRLHLQKALLSALILNNKTRITS